MSDGRRQEQACALPLQKVMDPLRGYRPTLKPRRYEKQAQQLRASTMTAVRLVCNRIRRVQQHSSYSAEHKVHMRHFARRQLMYVQHALYCIVLSCTDCVLMLAETPSACTRGHCAAEPGSTATNVLRPAGRLRGSALHRRHLGCQAVVAPPKLELRNECASGTSPAQTQGTFGRRTATCIARSSAAALSTKRKTHH